MRAHRLRRKPLLVAVVLLALAAVGVPGVVGAVDDYGDRKYQQRCVEHHSDFCNFDGDGDSGKPWWANGRGCEPQKAAEQRYYEACLSQAGDQVDPTRRGLAS